MIFYESSDITTKVDLPDDKSFKISMYESGTNNLTNTLINSSSTNTYVTNAGGIIPNNGVNFSKIRIEIKYKINDLYFYSTVLSDDWLRIKED